MSECIVITKALVEKIDGLLARGLSNGVGDRDGQMCVEAAICAALDLPHGDDPGCVSAAVRRFKIALNDKAWSSPEARAKGLRNLAIAQLGSKGVVSDREFVTKLAEKTIRTLLPTLIRDLYASKAGDPLYVETLALAGHCEAHGTVEAARALRDGGRRLRDELWKKHRAADAAAYAAAYAAAADAAADAKRRDKYLTLSADLALEVLRELKSPGCEWV